MRVLADVTATPEQLVVIHDSRPGITLIRGAAGSGKTTTALLRLRFLAEFWLRRREREGISEPVRALVMTYNRTLRGYIQELAGERLRSESNLELKVTTFAKWSMEQRPGVVVVDDDLRRSRLRTLASTIPLSDDFLMEELDYATGRFLPSDLNEYLTCRREGRGRSPRVERTLRERLLEEVVNPFQEWKAARRVADWNDLAVRAALASPDVRYDIVIVDEAQDFSGNQVRAILRHMQDDHSLTFVMDAAQRIHPRGFSWAEVGATMAPSDIYTLSQNYRNTKEIASFARSLAQGLEQTDDSALPDFESCTRSGPQPIVLVGRFSAQVAQVISYIRNEVDLSAESVAVLQPRGGLWFNYIRAQLDSAGLEHVVIARQAEWPQGRENIALSTLHSAKGLEFDHVCILGLNNELTPHGEGDEDSQLDNHRRLVAMAVGRARESVILGYKRDDASSVVRFFDPSTFIEIIA